MSAHEDGDVAARRAEEIKRLRETVDILTARHEAGLEDRDRLRNERDEARAEVERAEPRRQRDERDLADAFAERDRLRAELDELHTLVAAQAAILTGVANALRGPPGPLASHSHHDLAERAATVVRERDAAQTHRAIAVRERDIALSERDAARADDAMHFEQLRHVDGKLTEARAELASATALLRTRSREAAATIDALTRALADARAIIDGRLEPPTDAEIIAHWRAGGVWVHQSRVVVTDVDTAMRFAREQREGGSALRWVPMLAGRPHAWPVVKP